MLRQTALYILICCVCMSFMHSRQLPGKGAKVMDHYSEKNQFIATSDLIDASVNSINSLSSLIRKESYRNKISSFNNPASSDMGFSLETEMQQALKPLLNKAKNTNTGKFSAIAASLINNPLKNPVGNALFGASNIFSSLLGLVGNLAVREKNITRQDLDSFIVTIDKYFVQYGKLNLANQEFNQNISRLTLKLEELQFDTREYMLDMIAILYKDVSRHDLKTNSLEELFLKYLDRNMLENKSAINSGGIKYPGDGIKTAKEIVYGIQKLFNEYQVVYAENYNEINQILLQSKELGAGINLKQLEVSVQALHMLYNESKNADVLNIRMTTLFERLKILTGTEQVSK